MTIPIVFHPIYSQLTLPQNHRFPIEKYQGLYDVAIAPRSKHFKVHQVEGPVTNAKLSLVHSGEYIEQFLSGTIPPKAMKRIGFPWSEQFVQRTLHAVAGTIKTAELAAEHQIAINLTGGYHHAHPDFGSGFCVFNDLVLAAHNLIENHDANRVLIFDCDVHQGDGGATCAADHNDIFTVSIHCEKNFPARKQQSDVDVGLDKYLNDEDYLAVVRDTLQTAIDGFKPDFILYDAGVDIHQDDDLGLLNITTDGIKQRDLYVFETAKRHAIPIAAVIGGGYQRDINALVNVHKQLIDAAIDVFFV